MFTSASVRVACAAVFGALVCGAGTAQPVRWTPAAISSPEYEASPTFSPDGRTMIFLQADAAFRKYRLAETRCVGGAWSPPRPLPFAAPPAADADPFLSRDGRRLYFISTRADPTGEDFDIYVASRTAGGWSKPRRLPEPVNSKGSELLPREDGEGRLYFGSNRPGGQGQGDIYVATPGTGGRWSVRNLEAPVNTAAFEYEAEISRDGRHMVVVADRTGRSHQYRYRLEGNRWIAVGQVPAFEDQFQVGPLLSPKADRLLFAQRDGARSGEIFLVDLSATPDPAWPPACG